MRAFLLLSILGLLAACSPQGQAPEPPTARWTYPELDYHVLQTLAGRPEEDRVIRLVGWDKEYYYFDWSHATAVINRGTGRVDRKQFDSQNGGALTLTKGEVTLSGGQVRALISE